VEDGEEMGSCSDALHAVLKRFGIDRDEQPQVAGKAIPENVLVALSVVRETPPDWLANKKFWTLELSRFVSSADGSIPKELREALAKVGDVPRLQEYQQDWLKVSTGVRTVCNCPAVQITPHAACSTPKLSVCQS